jgi:putative DNA primase/helicase
VQAALEQYLDDGDLLILDNLSSLTAALRDNDPDSWTAIQLWLLRLRRRGISVIIVHHAGKGGDQRGTSRREDVIDTSICLQHPSDYDPTQGARFEVHIVKGRGLHGAPARAFEARLETRGDQAVWTVNPVEDVETARVKALLATSRRRPASTGRPCTGSRRSSGETPKWRPLRQLKSRRTNDLSSVSRCLTP